MGDVALTVPVIKGIIKHNQDIKITLVTKKFFAPFFYGIPRVELFFPDLKEKHKGIKGLYKLYKDLKNKEVYDTVIDLHSVLRTWFLCICFTLSGVPVHSINKGRGEKKQIIKTKKIRKIKHATERYLDVFRRAGLEGTINSSPHFTFTSKTISVVENYLKRNNSGSESIKIGIAPFALHDPKIWGIEKIKKLISLISSKYLADFYLFGGGTKEIKLLNELKTCGKNIHIVAKEIDFKDEIALMSILNFVISMDSANMHISSLAGTKTVSIWGGTHPAFGFSTLGQPPELTIQTPLSSLSCRPCSVYGKKPCIYSSTKCMDMITAEKVFETIEKNGLFNLRNGAKRSS